MESSAQPKIEVAPDSLRELRVYVTVPSTALERLTETRTRFRFIIRDTASGNIASRESDFRRP